LRKVDTREIYVVYSMLFKKVTIQSAKCWLAGRLVFLLFHSCDGFRTNTTK